MLPVPYYEDEAVTLYQGDALELLPKLPARSVHLLATDPPYYEVVDEAWDNQWDSKRAFLDWIGQVIDLTLPSVAERGTMAMFAFPTYACGVEREWEKRAHVLNHVVWDKPGLGGLSKQNPEELRSFVNLSERLIVAEHGRNVGDSTRFVEGQNHAAAREAYAPLREKLAGLVERAGLSRVEIDRTLGTKGMAGHYFAASQWQMPTAEAWTVISRLLEARGVEPPPYSELAAEYEELKETYHQLRRAFDGSSRVFGGSKVTPKEKKQLSDVWSFPTVDAGRTAHPTEKPEAIMRHIVATMSRPGDLVLDPFAGSGTTLVAAKLLGRRAVGFELETDYLDITVSRLSQGMLDLWDM